MSEVEIAGRRQPRVYRTSGRADLHDFVVAAVMAAGGEVIYASAHTRAPVFLGVAFGDERAGLLCYPFRATRQPTHNRPSDEHRLQVRYGAENSWDGSHDLGFDIGGVDTTLVFGVHLKEEMFVALDPLLYDPLPMGISVEFKDREVAETKRTGWHAWERVNRSGSRRATARSEIGLETLIGFVPHQFERYARFERQAAQIGFDPVLRMRAAGVDLPIRRAEQSRHALERTFHLSSQELLEIIAARKRLTVAVRGGVAEHHLVRALKRDVDVLEVAPIDRDGPPDVEVTLLGQPEPVRVECKNGEAAKYANGDGRVEVQKTRTSKGDPRSRFYSFDQFDVLAVCLWGRDGGPSFVYRAVRDLASHADFPDRIAALQRIDEHWATRLRDVA